MYGLATRFNSRCAWTLMSGVFETADAAQAKARRILKYDTMPKEYAVVPLGDVDDWEQVTL